VNVSGKSSPRHWIGLAAAGALFLVAVAGTSAWLVRSYVIQPASAVSLTPALAVSAAPGRGAPGTVTPVVGVAIGGLVRDEQGAPVPNVRVRLAWTDPSRPQGQNNQNIMLSTDVHGRWSFNGVPQAALPSLNLSLRHRDFVGLNPRPTPQSLMAAGDVAVLSHGVDVSGTVVDAMGWPVAGAQVSTGNGPGRWQPRDNTNDQGRFALHHIPRGTTVTLTAVRNGFAAALANVQTTDPVRPVRLVMPQGRLFSGEVADRLGKPVPDVAVTIYRWNGFTNPGNVRVNTDQEGLYEIRDAPAGALDVQITKDGFYSQIQPLPAGRMRLDFVISPVVMMRGRVIDAKTQRPIQKFSLVTGSRASPDQPPVFAEANARAFTGGRYQITFDGDNKPADAWFIRIEAPGYASATSPPLQQSGRQMFLLQPVH